MHRLLPIVLVPIFAACQPRQADPIAQATLEPVAEPTAEAAPEDAEPVPAEEPIDVRNAVVRVNSTQQTWNPWQPWEKNPPRKRRALAAIVAPQRVLTTAELAADANFLELESADGTRFVPAKVIVIDYEANLALLGPAAEAEGERFFAGTSVLETAEPTGLGGTLEILQIEQNGAAIRTSGVLQSVALVSGLVPGQTFLTYRVKASMQSAASSYSLPVLNNGHLAGVLLSYNSKDQICDVSSTEIVTRFLKEAADGEYRGFPSLGVATANTEDGSLRQWLGLADDQGGLYIRSVRKGGAAAEAGVQKGDVLLAIDGVPIDRRGYFAHPDYDNLSWGYLIRGSRSSGDVVTLSLSRDGEPLEIEATLAREDLDERLIPAHLLDRAPNFLVKGGLVFQELSRPLLESFGEDWRSRAPLELLDAFENPEAHEEEVRRIVFLSGVIPTPATVGYERLRNLVVHKVNGTRIKDMRTLVRAIEDHSGELHSIEFASENLTVHLDELLATEVDAELLQRGLNRLSRIDD